MYIPIQKNIHCEPCKECGARPVIQQLPKSKFKILCPTNSEHYNIISNNVEDIVDNWNKKNSVVATFRKVS